MPWQTVPGLAGKVYVPDISKKGKKYLCKDCFACQNCSQERCQVCREKKQCMSPSCCSHKEATP